MTIVAVEKSKTLMLVQAFLSQIPLSTGSFNKETSHTWEEDDSWMVEKRMVVWHTFSLTLSNKWCLIHHPKIKKEIWRKIYVLDSVCWCSIDIPIKELPIDDYNPEMTDNTTFGSVPSLFTVTHHFSHSILQAFVVDGCIPRI